MEPVLSVSKEVKYFQVIFCLLSLMVSALKSEKLKLLSDPNATPEAQALYRNLHKVAGKGFLLGHQDALAYGIGWKDEEFTTDVNRVTGNHPAVFGWDIGHIGDSVNIDGVPFDRMKKWIIQVFLQGGVNTMSWHMRHPGTGGSSWDRVAVVKRILPGGDLHNHYRHKLDQAASFFEELKTEEGVYVPIVLRLFHEHNGFWFWWSKPFCTPEEYEELWRFTVHYFRDLKGLHHLITAYSTDTFASRKEYLERYPGDDIIDILGYDDYKAMKSIKTQKDVIQMWETLAKIAEEKNKILILSESGIETVPDSTWWTDVLLANWKATNLTRKFVWALVWRNARLDHFYAPYPGQISAKNFKRFESDSSTLFLSDIKKLKLYE